MPQLRIEVTAFLNRFFEGEFGQGILNGSLEIKKADIWEQHFQDMIQLKRQ
jgi:hypothetical protein